VSTSLSASICTAPHAEPPFHASVPLAPTDSLLVCVVDAIEKKRKKRKHLQELEQQQAAVGTPAVATGMEGVALSVSVSCCPHFNNSSWSACILSLS